MTLSAMFQQALVRRVVYVLVAAVVAWLAAFGNARADDQAQAYNQTVAQCAASQSQNEYVNCNGVSTHHSSLVVHITLSGNQFTGTLDCPNSAGGAGACGQNGFTNTCGTKPDTNFNYPDLQNGDTTCHDACEYVVYDTAGGFASQAATGFACPGKPSCTSVGYSLALVDGQQTCRATDTDGDGIPDVDDDFPNDAGENTDSDGDGTGDNGDHAPNDPTDGKDEDDEGGDEGDNVSHGGGNCATPPSSTGDGILTQIAYQTWATRCADELTNDKLDEVKAAIVAQGPNVAGGGSGDTDDYDGNANGVPDYVEGLSETPGDLATDPDALWAEGGSYTPDEGGYGLSRSCPAPPQITLAGQVRTLDTSGLCDLAGIIGGLVLLMAAAHALWAFTQGS